MFRSFEKAEEFVSEIIAATASRKMRWEINRFGGFIEKQSPREPSWHLFGEQPLTLLLRGDGEAYDIAVGVRDNPAHEASLQHLLRCIVKQLGLLF